MASILIVEDSPEKFLEVIRVVTRIDGVEGHKVRHVEDAVGARRELKVNHYDLLIVDFMLPNRKGEPPQRDCGLNLIREIIKGSTLNVPDRIVGLTAFDDLQTEVEREFAAELWAVVKFKNGSDEWKSQLVRKVSYLLAVERGLGKKSRPEDYKCDVAIVTALDELELGAVKALKGTGQWEVIDDADDLGNIFLKTTAKVDGKEFSLIATSAVEMGMPAAAALASKVVHKFRPRLLGMVGICASISKDLNFGDIIIGDPSYDYGAGKFIKRDDQVEFLPAPLQIRLSADAIGLAERLSKDAALLERVRMEWTGARPDCKLRAIRGGLASGAAVLAAKELPDAIKEHNRKTIGIDMECYGVLHAGRYCSRPRPEILAIKSVADFANEAKDDCFQKYAAYTSASFFLNLSSQYLKSLD